MLRDIPPPRLGDEIFPVVTELVNRANRRIEGPLVIDGPNGVYIREPDRWPMPEPRRGRLLEPLYGCDSASAVEIIIDESGVQSDGETFTVTDPLSKVDTQFLAAIDSNGIPNLPTGTCFDCHFRGDAQRWEFDESGDCCTGSASGHTPESPCVLRLVTDVACVDGALVVSYCNVAFPPGTVCDCGGSGSGTGIIEGGICPDYTYPASITLPNHIVCSNSASAPNVFVGGPDDSGNYYSVTCTAGHWVYNIFSK